MTSHQESERIVNLARLNELPFSDLEVLHFAVNQERSRRLEERTSIWFQEAVKAPTRSLDGSDEPTPPLNESTEDTTPDENSR